jgi:antitoxin component of RelBE/YafQ-DinJ toxin-antitoxin module
MARTTTSGMRRTGASAESLTIRIDAPLKVAAEKAAAANDETLSQVIRRALREYVSQNAQGELLPAKPTRAARAKR